MNKLPPQSVEAEESILSTILIDNSQFDTALDIINSDCFYKSAHKSIFQAMTEIYESGDKVDAVTVANHLKKNKQLESTGGGVYLAMLLDTCPTSPNIKNHANIVKEAHLRRNLIQTCNQVMSDCFADVEINEIIDQAQKNILNVDTEKQKYTYSLKEILPDVVEKAEEMTGYQGVTGIPTHINSLNSMTGGLQNSDLIILAARPGMGKTSLALNIAEHAVLNGYPTLFYSIEMSKSQLVQRLLAKKSQINSKKFRSGGFTDEEIDRIHKSAGILYDSNLHINEKSSISHTEIIRTARKLKKENGIKMILIDYLQLIYGPKSQRKDLEVSDITRSLKGLAKELDLPVICLSQLNRMCEQRDNKRPRLSDLRESGAIEQDADIVAFIYRDAVYNDEPPKDYNESIEHENYAEINLAKHRGGPIGFVKCGFNPELTYFYNIDRRY